MAIDHAQERLIVAKLSLAIIRAASRHYFPDMRWGTSQELQTVALAVFIAHVAGRPKSATEIARYIEMPRPTVLRKLAILAGAGMIRKDGRKYLLNPERVNGPRISALVRANVRRIRIAAKALSKLDENAPASDT